MIDFDKCGGLVPAIVQDANTRKVLMLGYMSPEAYKKTIDTRRVTFWSRSRQTLWTKGETSGHYLDLVSVKEDCDHDALLVQAIPHGPTCHTGTDTCWGETNDAFTPATACSGRSAQEGDSQGDNPLLFLSELQDFIEQRHEQMPEGSYTTSLFRDGLNRMAQKVGEEALETVIEAVGGTNERLVYEGSDMLYHLIVLLTAKGLRIEDLASELRERHSPGWQKH
ncbi:MAG: bifunctional phosphoribosyl-AMP cyclohydrolase/phosphoribosyl-ATP diphosphatase HisIE [Prevotella sp.]|nr:bifunctional phosphoribosyl-AMP cyclohydrolase/phosphoribosyl-ATP diphosphatase HisIE [Prevotella sp.]